MDHERIKQQSEQGKLELEKAEVELEYLKLKLLQEGKLNTVSSVEFVDSLTRTQTKAAKLVCCPFKTECTWIQYTGTHIQYSPNSLMLNLLKM